MKDNSGLVHEDDLEPPDERWLMPTPNSWARITSDVGEL